MTLYEIPVKVKELFTSNLKKAKALEDETRVTILHMLSEREMSVDEITKSLQKRGIKKASNTIRHHLDILKGAGLIELARLEEAKGGMLKYYASNTKLLMYETPKEFDLELGEMICEVSREILKILERVSEKHKLRIRAMAEKLKPCPYCNTQHFEDYVLVEIVKKSLLKATQNKTYDEILREIEKD